MKKYISLLLVILSLISMLTLSGCQVEKSVTNKNESTRTVVELNENNYWKYFSIRQSGNIDDEKPTVFHEINGVLDFALYEDVVFQFDVIYYADGQPEEEYQSYTMRIACNAAGDAVFETSYLGITNVTVGKWLGTDGELVSLANYNWKIHFNSVSGKITYTV